MSQSIPDVFTKEEIEALYDRIRTKIEHEDNLVNQRIMWMITLQGFLFTAYGFSLSAEASSLDVLNSNPEAYKMFISTVITLHQAMVAVGIGSSFAALVGVVAAHRAIRDDERTLRRVQKGLTSELKTILKSPIGRRITNILGIICSLAIPFLGGVVWTWIGGLLPNLLIVLIALILIVVIGLALLPFFN
ncbi:hypothetical protein A4S05_36660 [Nostoc sp. KVJ20]|uniref:hypothetical protein n=1 Tax=Nostoc sp. KVJ20 TaxID=457944 RepID=UPI00083D7AC1|nr:hypothetical protein [Nostoc sp. KVJ20]ODG99741.1 hypothetical protein A4S05_36660 [Nostoc sp. KVJ20]